MIASPHASPTQTAKILAALEAGEALTPLDALNRFGCFRLGARIMELRKLGYSIETEMVPHGRKAFASYKLETI